jgi:phytoene dehydrogenase-like protein
MADDAIIIGGGHNGLAAGVVLARAGLKVRVLERNGFVGGMAATRELWTGFRHNVGAWALLVLPDAMIKELGLTEHGLEVITPRTSYCVFGAPEDPPFIFYTDTREMMAHLMTAHGPDALKSLMGLWGHVAVFGDLMKTAAYAPPEPYDAIVARTADEAKRRTLQQSFHGSAMDVIRRFFPDPAKHRTIQGSLAAMSIDGTHGGPWSAGTACSMSYHYTASGRANEFKMPRGGIGAVSAALRRALEAAGGEVRTRARVRRVLIEGGRAAGVELESGERLASRAVLSSVDARATFQGLLGEERERLPLDFARSIDEIDYTNGYVQLHLVLSELPTFTGHLAFTNENDIRWLMARIPSPDHLARCWEQYRRDEVPDDPVAYCTIPSVVDPSLASGGQHACTIFSHYFPAGGTHAEHAERKRIMADRVIDVIDRHAPGFRASIVKKAVLTHRYFESRFGITGGDFAHGLLHPGQMWDRRPVPGWSGYRTPVDGLYLCGSACHPGPGVTCMPGRNAAQIAAEDLR